MSHYYIDSSSFLDNSTIFSGGQLGISIPKYKEIPVNIMVDCSHGNSRKNHKNQSTVLKDIISQINSGNESIIGVMIESNINEGNQKLTDDTNNLKYGVSITDACISIEETQELLLNVYAELV